MRYKAIDFSYNIFDRNYNTNGDEGDNDINFVGALAGILKKPPGRFIDGRDDIIISSVYSYNLRNLYYVQLGNTPFYNYVTRKDQLKNKKNKNWGAPAHKQDRHFTMTRFFIKVVDETDPLFNIDIVYNCVDDYSELDTRDIRETLRETLRDLIITREQYNSLIRNVDSDDFERILAGASPPGPPDHFGRV